MLGHTLDDARHAEPRAPAIPKDPMDKYHEGIVLRMSIEPHRDLGPRRTMECTRGRTDYSLTSKDQVNTKVNFITQAGQAWSSRPGSGRLCGHTSTWSCTLKFLPLSPVSERCSQTDRSPTLAILPAIPLENHGPSDLRCPNPPYRVSRAICRSAPTVSLRGRDRLRAVNQDGNFNYQPRDTPEDLPAGTSPWPIESQCCVAGAPQPLCDFFGLEGPVFEFEVTIEQLGNFFCGARFPDLVQRA